MFVCVLVAGDFNILSESLHFLASSSSSIGPSDLFGHSLNASRERTFDRQHPEEAEAIRGTVEQLKKKEQAEGDERKGGVETATLRRRDGGVSAFTIIDFCRVQSVNAVENLSPRCRLVDGNYAALVIGVITISGEKMNEAINRDLLLVFIIAPPCLILLLILSGVLFLNYEKSVKIRQAQHSHTFLSSLAHDLRAPLNVMRFALDMMDGATIRAMYSYRALHTSIDSMVNLMSNVTFAYKLDSIKACPPQARNLRDDLTALAESFSFLANPKGIFVDVDIDYNLPSVVFVDWPAVQQVLSNLLSNAIKFTSEGGVVLRCSTDSSSFSPSSSASLVSSFSAGGRGGWGRSKKKRSGERREREREQPPRSVHRLPLSILSMQATGEGFFYRQNPNCPPEPPPEPLQASDLTQRREGFKSPFPPQTQQLPKARDQDCSENAGGAQIHEGGECVEKKVRGEWLQQNNAESDMHTASSPTHRLSARIAQKSPPNNKALHTLPLPCSMPPTQTLSSQEKEKEKKAIRGQGGGGGAGGRGGTDFLSQSVNSSSPSQAVSFMLTFAVDDSGPGMSETDPEKVGLGFCITNRIVKALGGRLSIKALTPRGTRVLIHSMPCSGHSEPLRANVSPSRGGLSDYACGLSISPSPAACLLLPSVRHVIGVSSARGRGAVLEQRGSGGGGGGGVSVSSSSDEGEGPPGLGECSGLLPFSSRSLEMEAMEESRVNHFVSLMAAPTTVSWTDLPTLLGKCQGRSSRVGRHQGRTLTEEGEGGEGKHEGGWRAQKERIAVPEGRMELFPSSSSPVPEKRPPVPPVEAPPFCIGGNWKEDRGQGVDGGDGREASGSSSSSSNKEAKRKSGSAEEGKVGGRNREEYPPSHPDGHSPPSSSSSSSDGGPSESRRSKEMMPQQLKDERGEGKGIDRDGDRDPRQPSWGAQAEAQANGERGRRRRRKTGETGKPSGRLPLPLEGTLVVLSSRLAELDGIPLSLFSPPETEAEGAVETPSASPCVQGGGGEGDTGGVCHFRILVETVRCVLEAGGGCICLSLAGGQGGLPDSILTEVGPRRVVFPPWTVSRLAEGAKHAREPLTCPSQPSEGPAAETKERGEEVLELMREGHQKGPSAEVSVTRLRGDQSRGQVVRPGFRVCVVDDDAMSREILVMLLQEKFGVTACEAKSGEVFLSLLDRGARFDLVLLDQHMPRGMGGCECARAVRARGLASPFPVVVGLSGDGSPEIVGECLGSGMDFFRQKPVGMGVLEGLLTEVRALSPACPN
uniref:histidine kinase n=1 Tax=Chromera velia CCMP2878 TaxID=1169474 RepID=A0A0G4FGM6_9ALVE|eukprot:Cvel_16833.t1-p1 / transcript=Cvel_16833.t1 / gene=Cvel_16833 / organism=Chromera_velia_CCMP2878 / gene_product=Aerobic respiration control sensor protein ArcB, putative / transcript_product=Aerobic respiration control sensor protein ArcB, putative / location=Cvel_scaffold1315:42979-48974(-) / protein_length=1265 / sequence_SO=supercontig / SO=protein_coding / is_pseudo=false